MFYVNTPDSKHNTVTDTSQVVDLELAPSKEYRFKSTAACWIAQGPTPTAAASTDGSMYVSAGETVIVNGGHGVGLAVIRAAGDGDCTLTPITIVR
jgi:hypothetical protein